MNQYPWLWEPVEAQGNPISVQPRNLRWQIISELTESRIERMEIFDAFK
jgi:hypothetical protein